MKNRKLIFEIMPEGVREFRVCGLNWISPEIPDFPLKCLVKVRTPGAMKDCAVEKIDRDTLAVMLKNPDSGIAPGQSAVFYRQEKDGLEILGGGIIR